jgi:hypothetical protein
MKKYRIMFLLLFFIIFSCINNKKEHNNIIEDIIIDSNIFNKELKIHLTGSSIVWSKAKYEYKIETTENIHSLLITQVAPDNIVKTYYKIFSDDEMNNIYNFIKEYEIEQIVENDYSIYPYPQSFNGSLMIYIENKLIVYNIISLREINDNLSIILSFLNDFIEDVKFEMPITGLIKHKKYLPENMKNDKILYIIE